MQSQMIVRDSKKVVVVNAVIGANECLETACESLTALSIIQALRMGYTVTVSELPDWQKPCQLLQ